MIIETGTPTKNGMYVAYIDNGATFIERKFLMFISGVWSYPSSDQKYRGEVIGWIGPLPVMRRKAAN